MEHNISSNREQHNKTNAFSIDENEITFRPLTDGLGFHKDKEEKKTLRRGKKPTLKKSFSVSQDTTTYSETSAKSATNSNPSLDHKSDLSVVIPGIEEFYGVSRPESKYFEKEDISYEEDRVEASSSERLFAWMLDVIIVGFGAILTVVLASSPSIVWANEASFPVLNSVTQADVFSLMGTIFVVYYLFYFALIERSFGMGFGKKVMGIQVVGVIGQLSIIDHFFRAVFTLISILLLGLPAVIKLQDKLTKSQVIRI